MRRLGKLEERIFGVKKKNPNRKKEHKLICLECSKEFYVDNYHKDKRKFCSRTCSSKYYHKSIKIERGTRKCLECGKEFEVITTQQNQKFCSHSCSGKFNRRKYLESIKNG